MLVRRVFIREEVPRIFLGDRVRNGGGGTGSPYMRMPDLRSRVGGLTSTHPSTLSPSSYLNHPASHSRPPSQHKVAKRIQNIVLGQLDPV